MTLAVFCKSRRSAIGIDLESQSFSAIQLSRGGGRRRVTSAAILPRQAGALVPAAAELSRLRIVLERAGFAGRSVVLAVPLDKMLGATMELPRGQEASYAKLARMEMARTQRCPPDSIEMACWELPLPAATSKTAPVMAVACRHGDADGLLDAFESAGFEVEALDARPCAVARAVESIAPPDDGLTALLELSWRFAVLVVVYRGKIIFERRLAEADLQAVHDTFCQRLHFEPDVADYLMRDVGLEVAQEDTPATRQARATLMGHVDALAAELTASFTYAGQQYPDVAVDQVLVCGTGALVPGIEQRLTEKLRVPARRIAPADLAETPSAQPPAWNSPALIAAMGLAMFGQ